MADFFGKPIKPEKFGPLDASDPKLDDFQPTSTRNVQSQAHRLIKGHEPVAREIGEREIVLSLVGATVKMHTKINGVVKSLVFT